jgi:hypothetical protein
MEITMHTFFRLTILMAFVFAGSAHARLAANGIQPAAEQCTDSISLSSLASQPLAK